MDLMPSLRDRREGWIARVVTRGPGALRGPERYILCNLPFLSPRGTFLGLWAHWLSKFCLYT